VLPTVLYLLLLQLMFSSLNWKVLLLVNNFFTVDALAMFSYWFIDVLIQIQIILVLLFSMGLVREQARRNPYRFAFFAMLSTAVIGAIIHQFWDTDYLYNRVPHMKIWLFFLGAAISYAKFWREKAILAGIALCGFYLEQLTVYALGCIGFIVLFNRLSVPSFLVSLVNAVAASSLFIYLTHFQFQSVYGKTFLPKIALADTLFAMAGGIIVWMVWSQLFSRALLWLSLLKQSRSNVEQTRFNDTAADAQKE
jgi:hypothetical protein